MNALQLYRWQFSHKETLQQTFFKRSATLDGKRPFCVFEPPWVLGATYDVHLRLTGKRVVDFLLVLIEHFFARCYHWGATSEYRLKIGDFALKGQLDQKFQVEVVAPTNYSSSQKKKQVKWFFVWYINLDRSLFPFYHNPCVWQTDRQTDGILIARPRLHSMQRGKNDGRRIQAPLSQVTWHGACASAATVITRRSDWNAAITQEQIIQN